MQSLEKNNHCIYLIGLRKKERTKYLCIQNSLLNYMFESYLDVQLYKWNLNQSP